MLNHPAFILAAAFLLDLLIGDPPCPLHPVRLIGRLIRAAENPLRALKISPLISGAFLPVIVIAVALSVYRLLRLLSFGAEELVNLLLLCTLLALKDLVHHAKAVEKALRINDLPLAQSRVQMLVGRNAALLDRSGTARAVIESVAENFVDGFLSPVFWYTAGALLFHSAAGGVSFVLVFKSISTLDSMVGYKNDRYILFGRVSAKLDDLLNFIPARLSIPLITLAARLTSNDWKNAWRTGWRDRLKHASPNSAHAEAAAAGALGLRLGGPTVYPHGTVEKPWLGDGTGRAEAEDIVRAVRMIQVCGFAALLVSLIVLI